jgi:hypothetical protein
VSRGYLAVRTVLLDYGTRVTPQHRLGRDDYALVVVGVRPPKLLRLSQGIQLLQRVVANDLQHGETWLSVERDFGSKQTLVNQRRDTVQNRRYGVAGAHRFSCLQRKARGEHTQSGQQPASEIVEEIVTPSDGGA